MCATRQLLVLVFAAVGQVFAADLPDAQYTEDAAKALVTTYPTYVEAGDEPGTLRWMDGTAVDFRAPEQVRPHALMLDDGTLWEQMLQAYPKGWPYAVPKANQDPGRTGARLFSRRYTVKPSATCATTWWRYPGRPRGLPESSVSRE